VERERKLTAEDLRHWHLLKHFIKVLKPVAAKQALHPTFSDPRRTLGYAPYLSLFLFGLFNPVVESMRQLCAISELGKVQRTTGCGKVSLGSFSETQQVLDPDLLKQVFEGLVEQMPPDATAAAPFKHLEVILEDGSLWSALPRMAWAEYGVGPKGQAKGVRLHLRFNLLKDCPEDALITQGHGSETAALREMLLPGQTNVGDRLYGRSYQLFKEIAQAGAFFVFRLSEQAVVHWEQELPISPADAQAGVVRQGWAHLGATEKLHSIRLGWWRCNTKVIICCWPPTIRWKHFRRNWLLCSTADVGPSNCSFAGSNAFWAPGTSWRSRPRESPSNCIWH